MLTFISLGAHNVTIYFHLEHIILTFISPRRTQCWHLFALGTHIDIYLLLSTSFWHLSPLGAHNIDIYFLSEHIMLTFISSRNTPCWHLFPLRAPHDIYLPSEHIILTFISPLSTSCWNFFPSERIIFTFVSLMSTSCWHLFPLWAHHVDIYFPSEHIFRFISSRNTLCTYYIPSQRIMLTFITPLSTSCWHLLPNWAHHVDIYCPTEQIMLTP